MSKLITVIYKIMHFVIKFITKLILLFVLKHAEYCEKIQHDTTVVFIRLFYKVLYIYLIIYFLIDINKYQYPS